MSKFVSLSVLLIGLSGCSSTSFQSVKPISIQSLPSLEERVPTQYKKSVQEVLKVRQFAIDHLGFYPDSKHYTWFAEQQNEHTLATLLVTDSITLPPSGKIKIEPLNRNGAYREKLDSSLYLFSEKDPLIDERDYYVREGFDTYWRAFTSYHTFGEGKGSPITPDFLKSDQIYQTQTIIHEMCHEFVERNIGINFPSELNESTCNFIGYAGALEYFRQRDLPEQTAALASVDNRLEFAKNFNKAHQKLSEIYAGNIPAEEKMKQRRQLFSEIRSFMGDDVNNAAMWSWYPYLVHFSLINDAYAVQGCDIKMFIDKMKDCPEDKEKALQYIQEMIKEK